MGSGKKKPSAGSAGSSAGSSAGALRAARAQTAGRKPKPWGWIIAIVAVVALAGGVFGYAFMEIAETNRFRVSEENKDPSTNIEGVQRENYQPGAHVTGDQRVDYDQSPPFGGPHDQVWADCEGVVYPEPVRSENMVHALEHGAVWIAYDPEQVGGAELDTLKQHVEGQPFMMLSPYPRLDKPISLQSWGHQLKVSSAEDERIEQFIKSLRRNQYQYPEVDASCGPTPGYFDTNNPPREPAEPPGEDAVPMDYRGSPQAGGMGQQQAPDGS